MRTKLGKALAQLTGKSSDAMIKVDRTTEEQLMADEVSTPIPWWAKLAGGAMLAAFLVAAVAGASALALIMIKFFLEMLNY